MPLDALVILAQATASNILNPTDIASVIGLIVGALLTLGTIIWVQNNRYKASQKEVQTLSDTVEAETIKRRQAEEARHQKEIELALVNGELTSAKATIEKQDKQLEVSATLRQQLLDQIEKAYRDFDERLDNFKLDVDRERDGYKTAIQNLNEQLEESEKVREAQAKQLTEMERIIQENKKLSDQLQLDKKKIEALEKENQEMDELIRQRLKLVEDEILKLKKLRELPEQINQLKRLLDEQRTQNANIQKTLDELKDKGDTPHETPIQTDSQ